MADATKPDRLRVLPDVSDIEKYNGITFIGADQSWKTLMPNRFRDIDDLKIRPSRVYDWLEALQAVHPSYANIIIDDSQPIANQLNSVTHKLILNAEILSSEIEINIDKVATERPANQPIAEDEINNEPLPTTETSGNTSASTIPSTFEVEETHLPNVSNEIEPMEMHSSLLTQRDPRQKNDKDEASRMCYADYTKREERLTNEEGLPIIAVTEPLFKIPLEPPTIQGIRDGNMHAGDDNVDIITLQLDEENPSTQPKSHFQNPCFANQRVHEPLGREETLPEEPNVRTKASKEPSNEYESNDDIIYTRSREFSLFIGIFQE
ncbi:Uncharacterized protein APZ42_031627, partial [Daphnia magna]